MSKTDLIVGFDLCRDYSQISYFDTEKMEPESMESGHKIQIPTALCCLYESRIYLAGQEAVKAAENGRGVLLRDFTENLSSDPVMDVAGEHVEKSELVYQYISLCLQLLKETMPEASVAYLTVTRETMDLAMADCIRKAGVRLGLASRNVAMQSHILSYEFYALSQRRDLWSHDVGLFEYTREGLKYHHLNISWKHRPATVVSETTDLNSYLNGSEIEHPTAEMDRNFTKAITEVSARRTISTFYLVGEGFEDAAGNASWMKQSLQQLCALRRHVFVGQNLYARGACYHSYYLAQPDKKPAFHAVNADLLTKEIYIKTVHRKSVQKTVLIDAGKPWYSASGENRIIVQGCSELIIRVHDLLSNIEQKTVLHFPENTDQEKKILLEIRTSFTDENICRMTARDIGFGELQKSTGLSCETRFDIEGIPDMPVPAENGTVIEAMTPAVHMAYTVRMSGVHVYTLEELCCYIHDNVYTLAPDFFDDALLNWIDCITGSHTLSLAISNSLKGEKTFKDTVRLFLNSVDYLSPAEINRVYHRLADAEKQNPVEHSKIAADNYCKYGHYMAALKNYNHVVYQMTHDYDKEVTRQFKAAVWHNMGVTLLKLHNPNHAIECLGKAYEMEKSTDYLKHYLYALELAGNREKFMLVSDEAHLGVTAISQIRSDVENAKKTYEASEQGMAVKNSLAQKRGKDHTAYDQFVQAYIDEQKKRYDL